MIEHSPPLPSKPAHWAAPAVAAVGLLGLAFTGFALCGGGEIVVVGVSISVTNPARPFLVAIVCGLILVSLRPGATARLHARFAQGVRAVPVWAWCSSASLVIVLVSLIWGSTVASASDAYGYITQAEMLADGALRRPESPLADGATWSNARVSLAPLGWRPAEPGALVPVYPPGYPLLMAVTAAVHPLAMFLVVPLAAAVTIVSLFALARTTGVDRCGWAAATLLATSPTFLISLLTPMSDMPAAAAWTLATALALRPGPGAAAAAGLAGGLGVLIRPNLAPLALAVIAAALAVPARVCHRLLRAASVAAGLGAGAVGTGLMFHAYYGSPFASGYGDISGLFALSHWQENVVTFAGWTAATEPWPVMLAGLIGAGLVAARRLSVSRSVLGVPAATAACYLFYQPFDNWTYLRFLLPAFPVAMLLAAHGLHTLSRRAPPRLQPYLFIGAVLWCGLDALHEARVRGVFANAASVERYRDVPALVSRLVPRSAVLISREFSGSLGYYADFETLRWDVLAPAEMGEIHRRLRADGLEVYAVLEARTEEPEFKARFHPDAGSLQLERVARYDGTAEQVTLYRLATR